MMLVTSFPQVPLSVWHTLTTLDLQTAMLGRTCGPRAEFDLKGIKFNPFLVNLLGTFLPPTFRKSRPLGRVFKRDSESSEAQSTSISNGSWAYKSLRWLSRSWLERLHSSDICDSQQTY